MKNLLLVAAAACFITTLNSCGTIANISKKGKTEVFMIGGPEDLQVSSGGKRLEIESEVFAASSSIGGDATTTYYTAAVNLPRKKKASLELYSPSMNKRATVALKPKVWGKIVFLDVVFGGIGLFVDIPTGNIRTLKPRMVDVQAALAGKPRSQWKSQGKMKRMTKRKIKRG